MWQNKFYVSLPRFTVALTFEVLPQLFKRISIRETNCVIHWIDFYPVDNAIQRLKNGALVAMSHDELFGVIKHLSNF